MSLVACPNCQREILNPGSECPLCGPTRSRGTTAPPTDPMEPRGYCYDAVAALVLAAASVFVWPLVILAVIYGLAALRTFRAQRDRHQTVEKGHGLAIAALVMAVVVVPLVIYGVVFV